MKLFIIFSICTILVNSYLDSLTDSVINNIRNCMQTKSTIPSTNCSTQAIAFLNALGTAITEVKSYSPQLPNNKFPGVFTGVLTLSASSVNDVSSAPWRARMDFNKKEGSDSWCGGAADNEYLQASSPLPVNFHRVDIRGRGDTEGYLTEFTISYSSDGITWTSYNNGEVFQGGSSSSQVVGYNLIAFTARAIRINHVSNVGLLCSKLEVVISKSNTKKVLPTNALIAAVNCGFNLRATSPSSNTADETRAVLNRVTSYGYNAWCSEFNDLGTWVMVSSFELMKWKRIDIQGQDGADNWVQSFKVSYTTDGESWIYYNNGEVLNANTDQTTVVTLNLTPFNAIAVRVHPQTWNTNICLRLEMYCSEI